MSCYLFNAVVSNGHQLVPLLRHCPDIGPKQHIRHWEDSHVLNLHTKGATNNKYYLYLFNHIVVISVSNDPFQEV